MANWLNELVNCNDFECVTDQLFETAMFMVVAIAILFISIAVYTQLKRATIQTAGEEDEEQ